MDYKRAAEGFDRDGREGSQWGALPSCVKTVGGTKDIPRPA